MNKSLVFNGHHVTPVDNNDGKTWFTAEQLAELLEYKDVKQVNKIYQRHADEFTETMTAKVTVSGKSTGYDNLTKDIRLFSLRGAYLVGMFSRTAVAKELRIWLLDLAEKESNIDVGAIDINKFAQLTGQTMHDLIASFDKASFKHRGQKGSGLMTQRKRDIKKVKEATMLALKLTQFAIADMGDFPEGGEPA